MINGNQSLVSMSEVIGKGGDCGKLKTEAQSRKGSRYSALASCLPCRDSSLMSINLLVFKKLGIQICV